MIHYDNVFHVLLFYVLKFLLGFSSRAWLSYLEIHLRFRSCSWDLWGRTWGSGHSVTNPFFFFFLCYQDKFLPSTSSTHCPMNEKFSILAEEPVCCCSCVLWVIFPLILVGSSFRDLSHFLIHTWLHTFLNSPMGLLQSTGFLSLYNFADQHTDPWILTSLAFWHPVPHPQFCETVVLHLESPCVRTWQITETILGLHQ